MGKRFFLAFYLILSLSCSTTRERKISDHYNGKNFFNPSISNDDLPGFGDVFRMLREPRAKWPERVENQGVPRLKEDLGADGLAITFINHSTFLIQLPGLNILADPMWSERASPVSWMGPKRVRPPAVKLEELPKIDLVLISHNHYDHLDKQTLKELNKIFTPKVIVPIGDKDLVESIGVKSVIEMDWWQELKIGTKTRITFAPTQHSSARGPFDRQQSLWGSYFIQSHGRSIYFGGDSAYSFHYSEIKKRRGPPEVALLPIGSYLPSWFMQSVHMNPAEAVQAHKDLGAEQSIGMHFGTFQLSAEAFGQPQADLFIAVRKEKLLEGSFMTLHEGETRVFWKK